MKILLISVFFIYGMAHAGTLQYATDTMNVTGYTPDGKFDPDVNRAEVITSSEPLWAVPTGGCSLDGRKRYQWSRVVTTSPLVLQLNPDLKFFRCHVVSSAADVRDVAKRLMLQAAALIPSNEGVTDLIARLAFAEARCVGNNSATCNSIRSNNTTIGGWIGSGAEILGYQSELIAIRDEAQQAIKDYGF